MRGQDHSNYKPVTLEDRLLAHFGVESPETEAPPEITWPGYVAPFIVRPEHRSELLQLLVGQYGLVPQWAPNLAYGRKTYNCRSESAAEKPSFREAWRKGRHCIIPAEEIYELCYETGSPVRWTITQNDGPMGIAGLWGMWPDPKSGARIPTFTMLTVNADGHEIFKRMHKPEEEKRMPVILHREDYSAWLDCPPDQAARYMKQFPAEWLHAEPSPVPPRPKSQPLPRARRAPKAPDADDTGSLLRAWLRLPLIDEPETIRQLSAFYRRWQLSTVGAADAGMHAGPLLKRCAIFFNQLYATL